MRYEPLASNICPRCNGECYVDEISGGGAVSRLRCKTCKVLANCNGTFLWFDRLFVGGLVVVWRPELICEIFIDGMYASTTCQVPWLPFDITKEQLDKYLTLI